MLCYTTLYLQGIFVFVFYVILNDPLKDFWLGKIGLRNTAKDLKPTTASVTVDTSGQCTGRDGLPAKIDDNANL